MASQSTTLPIMANNSASKAPMSAVSNVMPIICGRMPSVQRQANAQKFLGGVVRLIRKGINELFEASEQSVQHYTSVQTASAAMPSPRPVKPSFSVVVAFTLTWSISTPQSAAILAHICAVCGDSFGASQITVASILPTLYFFLFNQINHMPQQFA